MSYIFYSLILLMLGPAKGHKSDMVSFQPNPTQTSAISRNLIVSYSMEIKAKKGNAGPAEVYNGAVKTIFIQDSQARVRLVSLMRIQDIFFTAKNDQLTRVVLAKESGKKRYISNLSDAQWRQYNKKYDSVSWKIDSESISLMNIKCKRGVVRLRNGDQITVYFAATIQNPLLAQIEPAFSCVPGLVLKYEYHFKKGTITYTARSLTTEELDRSVFTIPKLGYSEKKFELPPGR